MSTKHNTGASFPDTRWTRVLTLREDADSETGRRALDELCEIYWRPLYAHARRIGHLPEAAEDLTQSFMLFALQRELLAKADHSIGRMRSYLLTLFKRHIHNEWRVDSQVKRGGGARLFSLDQLQETESHLANYQSDTRTPEALYDYECALTTIETAINKLGKDEHESGRGGAFLELRAFIDCVDMSEDSMGQVARRLRTSPGSVRQALFRLRKRLRIYLREVVADTLANPSVDEVNDELRHLKTVLAAGPPAVQQPTFHI